MRSRSAADGVTAGLLAGVAVIAVFFVSDLIRLDPFGTPVALTHIALGPGGQDLDLPLVATMISAATFGVKLIMYTALHFLVFAILGVGAVWCHNGLNTPGNVLTGAVYGLVVCTAVFYGSLTLAGADWLANPGWGGVLAANLVAGAVMGAYLQMTYRLRSS